MNSTLISNPQELHILQYDMPRASEIPGTQKYNPYHTQVEVQGQPEGEKITRTRVEDLQDFCQKTTAHGWGRLLYERHMVFKVSWAMMTLAAYFMNGWHITRLVMLYLDYPSEQQMRVQFSAIEFPSVTICNVNPISFTTGLELLQDPASRFYYWNILTSGIPEDLNLTAKQEEILINRLKQPLAYFENIGDESLTLGHQAHDFILRCTFSTHDCSYHNFTLFQSPSYFNCYTFNGGNLSMETLITQTTGPRQGLSIILYLENDNGDSLHNGTYHTLSNIGNAGGARVTVHAPNTRPSPVDHGIDIPPGFSSSIGVRVSKYNWLGPPYGECIQDLMRGSQQYVYSLDTCVTICQQEYIKDTCGCISSLLPIPEAWDDTSRYRYCGYFNESDPDFYFSNLSCEADKMTEFATSEILRSECGCHPPCLEYGYDNDVSYSYWPLDFTQRSFYESYVLKHNMRDELKAYRNLHNFSTSQLISLGLIRKNFIRLNVYLKDLVMDEVVQEKTYELENLFSDLGGTFGLWIGVSVLSLAEILELFGKLAYKTGKILAKKLNSERKVEPRSTSDICPY